MVVTIEATDLCREECIDAAYFSIQFSKNYSWLQTIMATNTGQIMLSQNSNLHDFQNFQLNCQRSAETRMCFLLFLFFCFLFLCFFCKKTSATHPQNSNNFGHIKYKIDFSWFCMFGHDSNNFFVGERTHIGNGRAKIRHSFPAHFASISHKPSNLTLTLTNLILI